MSMTRMNKNNIHWGVDTSNFQYKKLADLEEGKVYQIFGMFISKDQGYGEGAVLILENCFVNIPGRYCDDIREALADREEVKRIQDGKDGFLYELFDSKFGKKGYSVKWVDVD